MELGRGLEPLGKTINNNLCWKRMGARAMDGRTFAQMLAALTTGNRLSAFLRTVN
jgi:hypothetical protein